MDGRRKLRKGGQDNDQCLPLHIQQLGSMGSYTDNTPFWSEVLSRSDRITAIRLEELKMEKIILAIANLAVEIYRAITGEGK